MHGSLARRGEADQRRYDIFVTDACAPSGPTRTASTLSGLAADIVPGPGSSWREIDRLARKNGRSIFDAWRGDAAAPSVDRLGSGSDYTVFLDHLGAAAGGRVLLAER